jgi:hypothetical protein
MITFIDIVKAISTDRKEENRCYKQKCDRNYHDFYDRYGKSFRVTGSYRPALEENALDDMKLS